MNGRYTLSTAADFLRGKPVPRHFSLLVQRVRSVFSFTAEHTNRLSRFVKIVNAYKRGALVQDIENEYGCTKSTILRYARLAGIAKRDRGFDPKIKEGVLAMYALNKPISEIAVHFGVSEAYVSKTASEAGISRRKFKKRRG